MSQCHYIRYWSVITQYFDILVEPCSRDPCMNGGVCTRIIDDIVICECPSGTLGSSCQFSMCQTSLWISALESEIYLSSTIYCSQCWFYFFLQSMLVIRVIHVNMAAPASPIKTLSLAHVQKASQAMHVRLVSWMSQFSKIQIHVRKISQLDCSTCTMTIIQHLFLQFILAFPIIHVKMAAAALWMEPALPARVQRVTWAMHASLVSVHC